MTAIDLVQSYSSEGFHIVGFDGQIVKAELSNVGNTSSHFSNFSTWIQKRVSTSPAANVELRFVGQVGHLGWLVLNFSHLFESKLDPRETC